MQIQKKLMLINPIASLVYGLWFVILPNGYLRIIEGLEGDIPTALTSTFVSLGATLIALGIVQWIMRSQTTRENIETNMVTFGAVWAVIGIGMLVGVVAYSDTTRSATVPIVQAFLYFAIAVTFFVLRKPKSARRAS